MFFAATGSKSNMLMASFGEVISLSSVRGAQIMGSGSRDGASAAMAARSDVASSGLAARNCRNLRRLVTWSSIGIGDPPYGDARGRNQFSRRRQRQRPEFTSVRCALDIGDDPGLLERRAA